MWVYGSVSVREGVWGRWWRDDGGDATMKRSTGWGCEVRHFPTSALLTTNRQLESRRDGRCEHCYSLHAHTYSCLGIREIKVVALFNAPKQREKEGERERERERKKGVKGEGGRQPMKAANNRAVGQEVLGESESDMSE